MPAKKKATKKPPLMVTKCSACGGNHKVTLKKLKKPKELAGQKFTHSYTCGSDTVYSRLGGQDAGKK